MMYLLLLARNFIKLKPDLVSAQVHACPAYGESEDYLDHDGEDFWQ